MILTKSKPQSALCDDCPLNSRQLCRFPLGLSDQFAAQLVPRLRTIAAETRLQEENERPRFAGILRRGYLRTERILSDGRRSVLNIQAPGDLIGCVFGSVRGPALVAATDVEYCAFDPATLRRTLQVDTSLKAKFLAEAIRQNTRQLEMVWRRGALNSRERIVAFLVMAAEFMPTEPQPDGSVIVTITLSRKDWADFSNTTVETICRILGYLAETDMVSRVAPSRYRIRDLGVLTQLAGLDSLRDRNAMVAEGLPQRPGVGQSPSPLDKTVGPHTQGRSANGHPSFRQGSTDIQTRRCAPS
ncbi:Crp/Fnr family transcriptional regulator [Tropicimonas sp. IMCC34043]|uniref:Crp/Fnr family transcriptional regulator n=1 Tax=Tropicimonas sp. IMCC34043 TaxID=2248760 RepID=UPI00130052A2|nr:Crp/Fnr family transcriptional regulator [Tropicimonas sp. IMCC34043]